MQEGAEVVEEDTVVPGTVELPTEVVIAAAVVVEEIVERVDVVVVGAEIVGMAGVLVDDDTAGMGRVLVDENSAGVATVLVDIDISGMATVLVDVEIAGIARVLVDDDSVGIAKVLVDVEIAEVARVLVDVDVAGTVGVLVVGVMSGMAGKLVVDDITGTPGVLVLGTVAEIVEVLVVTDWTAVVVEITGMAKVLDVEMVDRMSEVLETDAPVLEIAKDVEVAEELAGTTAVLVAGAVVEDVRSKSAVEIVEEAEELEVADWTAVRLVVDPMLLIVEVCVPIPADTETSTKGEAGWQVRPPTPTFSEPAPRDTEALTSLHSKPEQQLLLPRTALMILHGSSR
jgi:hypothetical protein